MKLNVFNDAHGFFLNLTVNRVIGNGKLDTHLFINLNTKTVYPNDQVTYLKRNILFFRRAIRKLPAIESVTFYPFDFTAAFFLKELRKVQPTVQVWWVFWSYEFYHRPDNELLNFDPFSLAYYRQKNSFFNKAKQTCAGIIKKLLFIPVYNKRLLDEGYKQISRFYSVLPEDFNRVFRNVQNSHCTYYPISFLSIENITQNVKKAATGLTETIMIGHAATPSINHAEILSRLSAWAVSNRLFIPLEYGENIYREKIKEMANAFFPGRVEFLEQRLEMHLYYQRLSEMGYAVFNFRWQEALGNIFFLIWNGCKVFLKEESSVYMQFKQWGITIFSIEREMVEADLTTLLPFAEADNNKRILERIFSEKIVNEYWTSLVL